VILRIALSVAADVAKRTRLGGALGLAFVALVAVVSLLAPLGGYPVGADVDGGARSLGPSAAHWLGTDHLGRDLGWRLALASRAFVGPGVLSCLVAAGIGVPLGAVAGWSGGGASLFVRTGLGSIAAVPRLVLVLLLCAVYGSSPVVLAAGAGLAAAPPLAEAVYQRIERLRREQFVLAARAHGLSEPWLVLVHLVGAACGRSIARHLLEAFGAFVVLECTLSYLGGLGVQEPSPSWGNMLAFEWGRGAVLPVFAPGLAIWLTIGGCALAASVFAEVEDG
jgi:peptide/nickel transport system permease protein